MEHLHSKGKWTAHKVDDIWVIKEEGLMEKGFSDRIAELHQYPEQIESNAKLIAAAPEMLEALEKVLDGFNFLITPKERSKSAIYQRVLNAIKSATE